VNAKKSGTGGVSAPRCLGSVPNEEVNVKDLQAESGDGNFSTSAAMTRVPFRGDTLEVTGDGEWAVVKRLCENLGVQPHVQAEKLKAKAWAVTRLIRATAADGKNYETFCIHRNSLAMWLATIEPGKPTATTGKAD